MDDLAKDWYGNHDEVAPVERAVLYALIREAAARGGVLVNTVLPDGARAVHLGALKLPFGRWVAFTLKYGRRPDGIDAWILRAFAATAREARRAGRRTDGVFVGDGDRIAVVVSDLGEGALGAGSEGVRR